MKSEVAENHKDQDQNLDPDQVHVKNHQNHRRNHASHQNHRRSLANLQKNRVSHPDLQNHLIVQIVRIVDE